ncbi:hypothetical protein [Clostridium sp. OS1-26]|nr:hypothetical protein [Clostridium sp. OS1-26]WML32882.1 hypothetical protein RCG18_16135 [Clostridium sp. OS1-26]
MSENKLTKRKIQAINTKEQILKTSIELIAKKVMTTSVLMRFVKR